MAKQAGMGDRFYVDGVNLSGDIGSLSRVGHSRAIQDDTGIDKSAFERLHLAKDGSMEFTAFFNPTRAHPELSTLPTGSRLANYYRGFAQGAQAAGMLGKQINYDPTRGQDGSLTIETAIPATDFGLEWGVLLSDGDDTLAAGASGTALDLLAETNFGLQAYLQVSAGTVTGVQTVDIAVQDSADGSTLWADVAAFTQITVGSVIPLAERIQTSRTENVRRFLRYNVVGTFTSITFNIVVVKNVVETLF